MFVAWKATHVLGNDGYFHTKVMKPELTNINSIMPLVQAIIRGEWSLPINADFPLVFYNA